MTKAGKKPKRATLDELNAMKKRGEIVEPREDASEREVSAAFWEEAEPFIAPDKTSVHLRLDSDVFEWFRAQGKGHLTRMNAVLRSYYEAHKAKES